MTSHPAQHISMIAIDCIAVINPRVRNRGSFRDIVDNIADIGLKRPITVTQRADGDGSSYDLVCGQGRLEAYIALGQTEVPALVIEADRDECLVASLVENCARRQHTAVELLQDIGGMAERGYSPSDIAQKTGLKADYVRCVIRLLANGEQRLLRSVERGTIPLSVAVEIADAKDSDMQTALTRAYEGGLLKGRKLLIARKVIEDRRRHGKGLSRNSGRRNEGVSAKALVKAYKEDADRKRSLIERAHSTKDKLLLIVEALRRLSQDSGFISLLEKEHLPTLPSNLALRLRTEPGAVQ
ncbi:plasmid partitioning protein RepB C-terminal domain-containing protein [Altererythrobacter sp. Root672]|uniref:plasmid partitioning protein RepB C-terminal domain-containing protein n=1 Tax=Altererythrobacter sp. Root672 TaxID=1736584 RepID=UPI0006F80E3E|nr:plasmid partitioning protein RepB C-terminal domain-containing protein [Altererythrobacter sp. Root672]KRA82540.1 chromosome partitioning protein ParB [Altererythrobacter sp. Root672]